jgi:hypothetical protein
MWLTVFVMALAVSTEPFRLGMTVLLLNRPRPVADLLAFLCGGFVMGITVGVIVLFGLGSVVDSAHVTLPKVQIGMGLVALTAAAVLAVIRLPDRRDRDAEPGRLTAQARRLLNAEGPWVAGAAGLGIALPSVDYLAALAVILTSQAPPAHQIGALVMFTVVAFALVEIPLVAYLFAPERTRAAMARLNAWFALHRRRALAITLAVIGAILLTVGLITL